MSLKLLVQGRIDGYQLRPLYSDPSSSNEFYHFRGEVQQGSPPDAEKYWGKSLYTIAFAVGGLIYTKYAIGYDVHRGAYGNVGVSLFIGSERRMQARYIKTLLDELMDILVVDCCPEGDFRLSTTPQNWSRYESLIHSYNNDNQKWSASSALMSFESGGELPAIVYYNTNERLLDLLDNPYQEEYRQFQQIYLIDSSLRDESNPIRIFRNSGKVLDVDLNNQYLYFTNYTDTQALTIYVNESRKVSTNPGENYIRLNDRLRLVYDRDPRCFEKYEREGTLSDENSELNSFLQVSKLNHTVSIDYNKLKLLDLGRKKWAIEFRVDGVSHLTKVKLRNESGNRSGSSNYIHPGIHHVFSGEEIIDLWSAEAVNQAEGTKSDSRPFRPFDITEGYIVLKLESEIQSPETKTYKLDFGAHAEKGPNCPDLSKSKNGEDIKVGVHFKVKNGYTFKRWELKASGVLEAQFEKNPSLLLISSVFVGVFLLVIGVALYFTDQSEHTEGQNLTKDWSKVENYLSGDALVSQNLIDLTQEYISDSLNQIYKDLLQTSVIRKKIDDGKWDELVNIDANNLKNSYLKRVLQLAKNVSPDIILDKKFSQLTIKVIADSLKKLDEQQNTRSAGTSDPAKPVNNNSLAVDKPVKESTGTQDVGLSKDKEFIKGGEVTKAWLEERKNINDKEIKRSVEVYLRFWNLFFRKEQKKDEYGKVLDEVKVNNLLKSSVLKTVLLKICESTDEFRKFKQMVGKARVKTIEDINKKITE